MLDIAMNTNLPIENCNIIHLCTIEIKFDNSLLLQLQVETAICTIYVFVISAGEDRYQSRTMMKWETQ